MGCCSTGGNQQRSQPSAEQGLLPGNKTACWCGTGLKKAHLIVRVSLASCDPGSDPLRGRLTQRAFLSPCCRFIGRAQSRYCRDRPYAQYLDRELSPVQRSAASPKVAPLRSESQARPAKVTRECSTNTRKKSGSLRECHCHHPGRGSRSAAPRTAPSVCSAAHQCAPRRRPATLAASHRSSSSTLEDRKVPSERYFHALLTGEKIPRQLFSQRA